MPPRLITGITLLFWGAMTNHALLGLAAALLVEARSWIGTTWKFTQKTYIRSWHYTILCGALIAILAWVNGMKASELHTLFIWAPLIFLPLELTMRYGQAERIPLNTFSFFARKKYAQTTKSGHAQPPFMIHTGWPYLALTLLAAAMGSTQPLQHGIGFAVIATIALIASGKKTGTRPVAWTICVLLTLTLSLVGQWGMVKLYQYYQGIRGETPDQRGISSSETRTSIGRLGQLKLSPHIFWRMKVHTGTTPRLLRVATYNRYARANWKYKYTPASESEKNTTLRDEDGYLPAIDSPNSNALIFRDNQAANDNSPPKISGNANISIIGEINAKRLENPIPMPDFTQAIGNLSHLGKETSLESNPLGTVRLVNPDTNIVQYRVWRDESAQLGQNIPSIDTPPNATDLGIPQEELQAIQRISHQLGLDNPELSTTQKILKLKLFFTTEFTYTTHLNSAILRPNQRKTAVGTFLETTRAGHCEYFATATTLLLRDAGIPARYCIGFAVSEKDKGRDEWIMRGKHAHAWCRVWMSENSNAPTAMGSNAPDRSLGHWEDLDLTPPSWESVEKNDTRRWLQNLTDWWQLFREDFMIWRTQKNNQSKTVIAITIIISLLTLWMIWKLWQSRHPKHKKQTSRHHRPANAPVTALNHLEPYLSKHLGSRPTGTPITRWLTRLADERPELSSDLQKIATLHNAIRFSTEPLTAQQRELATACDQLKKSLNSKNHAQISSREKSNSPQGKSK